jgi:hypothetical protein
MPSLLCFCDALRGKEFYGGRAISRQQKSREKTGRGSSTRQSLLGRSLLWTLTVTLGAASYCGMIEIWSSACLLGYRGLVVKASL